MLKSDAKQMTKHEQIKEIIKHASIERPMPPMTLLYGPLAKSLRAKIASVIHGREIKPSHKEAQWGNFCDALFALLSIQKSCTATMESEANDALGYVRRIPCTCHIGVGDCDVHGKLDRVELRHGRRVRI